MRNQGRRIMEYINNMWKILELRMSNEVFT